VRRQAGGLLLLEYRLTGALARIRTPAFAELRREDRLWEHTCFELFVRRPGRPDYCELNVATSGAWAAYAFSSYRRGMRPLEPFEPRIEVVTGAAELHVCVTAPLIEFDSTWSDAVLEVGPSAVVENSDGQRSYWAAHHAIDKPDFHHPDAFVVALDAC
jgi:hypothetical protein